MKIDCLLDANSLIKYYVDLPGSETIKHLFSSPLVQINIANIQIVEIISLFYQFRRQGAITSDELREEFKDTFFNDIKIKKILVYDFAERHIMDFEVYDTITNTPPPFKHVKRVMVPEWGGFYQQLKDIANNVDAILLMIMREMHLITQGQCHIVTSDGHVKMVAESFSHKLNVIDPEKTSVNDLRKIFDVRNSKRIQVNLKANCIDCASQLYLATAKTSNISDTGLCLEIRDKLKVGKNVEIKLSTYDRSKVMNDIKGQVVWSDYTAARAGIQFTNSINSSYFLN